MGWAPIVFIWPTLWETLGLLTWLLRARITISLCTVFCRLSLHVPITQNLPLLEEDLDSEQTVCSTRKALLTKPIPQLLLIFKIQLKCYSFSEGFPLSQGHNFPSLHFHNTLQRAYLLLIKWNAVCKALQKHSKQLLLIIITALNA